MFPIRDNIPSRTVPIVNYAIIGLCALAFLAQLGDQDDSLVYQFGMVPLRVFHPEERIEIREVVPVPGRGIVQRVLILEPSPVNPWITLLTCIFLHGGWMHFLGNMWFLYIFGDNVEDRIGHVGYLLFYLFCGVAASFAHLMTNPESPLPTIGASGAIAGVMGAYFLFYPRARVLSVVPIFVFLHFIVLPAPVFLGIWFLLQLFQSQLITDVTAGGVAWWAHIGGFIVGALGALLLNAVGETRPPVRERIPDQDHHAFRRHV